MNFYRKWLVGTLIGLGYVTLILFGIFTVIWFTFEQPILGAILLTLVGCVLYGWDYAYTMRSPRDVKIEEYKENK